MSRLEDENGFFQATVADGLDMKVIGFSSVRDENSCINALNRLSGPSLDCPQRFNGLCAIYLEGENILSSDRKSCRCRIAIRQERDHTLNSALAKGSRWLFDAHVYPGA